MTQVTIGADPEFFVKDDKGKLRGAWEFFPGDKNNPYPLIDGNVQVDGFAVEIGVDPSTTSKEFDAKVVSLIEQCKHFIPDNYTFVFEPYVEFDEEYFQDAPAEHKAIGCSPAWSFSTHRPIETPSLSNSLIRYGGGHIHLGFGEFDVDCDVTQFFMDQIASQVSMRVGSLCEYHGSSGAGSYPSALKRRRDYKTIHSIRHKPYGFEHRRPSNYWTNPEFSQYRIDLADKYLNTMKDIAGG